MHYAPRPPRPQLTHVSGLCHGIEIENVVVTDAALYLNVVAMEEALVESVKEIVLEKEKACEFFI